MARFIYTEEVPDEGGRKEMKTFMKTLIGGALGLGALYVVGKICYEAGKDVAEVERQLELGKTAEGNEVEHPAASGETQDGSADADNRKQNDEGEGLSEYRTPQKEELDKVFAGAKEQMSEIDENRKKHPFLAKTVDKIYNAKMFVRVKKAFEKKGARSPGILGSLLSNPDGAKIEAFVKNGGVQINVTPALRVT